MDQKSRTSAAKFCVVPQSALAVFRQRSGQEAVRAQAKLDDSVVSALEDMVKAARAGRLEGEAALDLQALTW